MTIIIICIAVVIGIILMSVFADEEKKKEKEIISTVQASGYETDKGFRFANNYIFLNIEKGEFVIVDKSTIPTRYRNGATANIRDYEIVKNGETVFKKSNLSTIGRAAVGGILLGGAGAVIGGLSGSSKGVESIVSAGIKLYTNDPYNPSFFIPVIDKGTKEWMKKAYLENAEKFCDTLALLIK